MHVRLSILSLLIVATMTLAISHPLVNDDGLPASRQEKELTPEEEQEARAISRRFNERLRATNDLGGIIDEMFVKDFAEHLRRAPQDWLPWMFLDKNLMAYASPDELRRYYVAAMNFYGLYFRLHEEAKRLQKQSENNEDELKLEDVLSSEVINTLLSDPTFAEFAELAKKEESDGGTKDDNLRQPAESGDSAQAAKATTEADANESTEKSEIGIIKHLPQLNAASATFEKANELMRKRLAEMSRKAQAASKSEDTEKEPDSPYLTSLNEWEYGYPENTPVIHVEGAPFCLYLIKVDGQLRILSAHIYGD
jgi:hypothetical protein